MQSSICYRLWPQLSTSNNRIVWQFAIYSGLIYIRPKFTYLEHLTTSLLLTFTRNFLLSHNTPLNHPILFFNNCKQKLIYLKFLNIGTQQLQPADKHHSIHLSPHHPQIKESRWHHTSLNQSSTTRKPLDHYMHSIPTWKRRYIKIIHKVK